MSIRHKFYQHNFGGGFQTHNAILDITPYLPEVMIVGTFNPDTPNANFADFFYGRNFFWRAFKNLFVHNEVALDSRRMPPNGIPQNVLDPTLHEVLEICRKLKLTFSDIVLEVLHNNNPQYQLLGNDNVVYADVEYNLIQDGRKQNVSGLAQLSGQHQVNWNTQNIIDYLCKNQQIHYIYFTRRPTGIWAAQWNAIVNSPCVHRRIITNIFTPSGAGKPVYHDMTRLLRHWVHNANANFGCLDNMWLQNNGVTLNNF